jgi:hypothetical protein
MTGIWRSICGMHQQRAHPRPVERRTRTSRTGRSVAAASPKRATASCACARRQLYRRRISRSVFCAVISAGAGTDGGVAYVAVHEEDVGLALHARRAWQARSCQHREWVRCRPERREAERVERVGGLHERGPQARLVQRRGHIYDAARARTRSTAHGECLALGAVKDQRKIAQESMKVGLLRGERDGQSAIGGVGAKI